MRKIKTLWVAKINLSGLYCKIPTRVKVDEGGKYWDKEGNFDVIGRGTHAGYGHITFASENKKEVQLWIDGVRAAMTMLKSWSHYGFKITDDGELQEDGL
jgi:hypothetical protein